MAEDKQGRQVEKSNVWQGLLGGKGEFKSSVLASVVSSIFDLGVKVRFNQFTSDMEVDFTKSTIEYRRKKESKWEPFKEQDVLDIQMSLGQQHHKQPDDSMTRSAIAYIGHRNEFDPARDALQALKWDGVKRLDDWLAKYCGVTDAMCGIYGPKWFIGLAARVWGEDLRGNRSVKNDTALVLVGAQGGLKSTAFRTIAEALMPDGFNDSFAIDMDTKKVMEQSRHKIILEAADMRLSGRDADKIKQMLSKQDDTERLVWRRDASTIARRFVIVGTTNKENFLHDETGDRRFWVVRVPDRGIKIDELRRDAAQLWAEAYVRFTAQENWWLSREESLLQEEANREFIEDEPWYDVLAPELDKCRSGYVRMETLFKIVKYPQELVGMTQKKIMAKVARKLGLRRAMLTDGRDVQMRVWAKGDWTNEHGSKKEMIDRSNVEVLGPWRTRKIEDDGENSPV